MVKIKLAFSDKYIYELPEGHRFPITKYELVKEQLLYQGIISEDQIYDPGLCSDELILKVHDKAYWEQVKSLQLPAKVVRSIGLPVTEKSVNRARNSSAGTVKAAISALEHRASINIAGGTHHAFRGRGEGFCVLNDIAIAAQNLLDEGLVKKVLVVDLDVHQGNGTAAIFHGYEKVFTFSMHGKDNYPLRKEQSDLDIGLPTGTNGQEYLQILKFTLDKLFLQEKPDFVFYQAGVDVLETDQLGKLLLTKQECAQRDEVVLEACFKRQIPLAVTMGGGYSKRLADVVDAHCNTFKKVVEVFG